ncbi:MAG: hypothetical protein LBS79_11970, partial [Tannerella sp.]|nr:hypothetical protein [Tannerella sp.]
GDGSGRAAAKIARRFSVSQAAVYQARALLRSGDAALIESVRDGSLSLYAACKKTREKPDAAPTA